MPVAPHHSQRPRTSASPGRISPARSQVGSRRRLVGMALALVTPFSLVAVGFLAPVGAHAAPPTDASDAQIQAAAAKKAQAAKDVGRLSGLIASADTQISHLDGLAELAKERYLKALSELTHAKQTAVNARTAVVAAQRSIDAAQAKYRQFIIAAYMNRDGDTSGVLTSSDPNALLRRGDLQRYASERQINAMDDMKRATVVKSNADASARVAVDNQTAAANNASQAQRLAVAAVATARTQRLTLVANKARYQQQLQAAGMELIGLQNQHAAFLAWQAEQARIAAAEAERKRRERAAALAAEAARLAAIQAQQNNDSGGSDDSGGSGSGPVVPYTGSGAWTPAQGQAAANRALHWLGEPYSFAAGDPSGPTWGVCGSGDAGNNDCHVFGFDCSGLALYAWYPYIGLMDHFAATQYYQAGSVHPSVDQLMPGDLVFWSSDGSEPAIHHVAIYIGGGQVVQAPQSGDVVKISDLWMDEYYGATRPNT